MNIRVDRPLLVIVAVTLVAMLILGLLRVRHMDGRIDNRAFKYVVILTVFAGFLAVVAVKLVPHFDSFTK